MRKVPMYAILSCWESVGEVNNKQWDLFLQGSIEVVRCGGSFGRAFSLLVDE